MAKVPTRSPTHREVEFDKLAALGLELDDIADGETVPLQALVEHAEDRGRPPSHFLAGLALATDYKLAETAPVTLTFCAGKCQSWGALDCIDHAVDRWRRTPSAFAIRVVSCLDRCDKAAVFVCDSAAGTATVEQARAVDVDTALGVAGV